MLWAWWPGMSNPDSEGAVFNTLWRLTGVRPEIIRNNYENYAPGNYVPVGEASAAAVNASAITGYSGVQASRYPDASATSPPGFTNRTWLPTRSVTPCSSPRKT